jgi:hypothetical protein
MVNGFGGYPGGAEEVGGSRSERGRAVGPNAKVTAVTLLFIC